MIWSTCSKYTTGTPVHSQGIRTGLYTCLHSLTAGFIYTPSSAGAGGTGRGQGVWWEALQLRVRPMRSGHALHPLQAPHSTAPAPCPMSHAQLWEQGLLEVPAPTPWGQGAVCGNRPMCLCTVSHCRDISTLGVEGRTTQNKICISLQGVSARGWAPSPAVTSRKQHPAAS